MRVLGVKEFGVKLDAEEGTGGVLHGLNRAGLVRGGALEAFGQFFDFVEVRMPDREASRQAGEDSRAVCLDIEKAALS